MCDPHISISSYRTSKFCVLAPSYFMYDPFNFICLDRTPKFCLLIPATQIFCHNAANQIFSHKGGSYFNGTFAIN